LKRGRRPGGKKARAVKESHSSEKGKKSLTSSAGKNDGTGLKRKEWGKKRSAASPKSGRKRVIGVEETNEMNQARKMSLFTRPLGRGNL